MKVLVDHASAARAASSAALAALLLLSPVHDAPLAPGILSGAASARELASGSGSRVNKDPSSLLRLGLPAQPKALREVQAGLEEADDSLQRLLLNNAKSAVDKARAPLKGQAAAILQSVPATSKAKAEELVASIASRAESAAQLVGSNEAGAAQTELGKALGQVTALEELIAAGTTQPAPPKEFGELPYLTGRATVEFLIKRPGGTFDVDGKLYPELKLRSVVDGYTAPLTAGNFLDLVQKGFYNGMKVQRSDGFVVQTGDPAAEGGKADVHGFIPAGSTEVRKLPLEVFVKGDKAPLYSSTFDDDGRGGYAAALPFNAFGAMGMAREEYDVDSASSQWFWLLFDSDLTPAGKNLLDGRYSCFGYTVEGARLLADVKEGDVIVSAKVVDGLDRLSKA